MIRINLTPSKKKRKKPKPVPGFLIGAVMLLVLSVVLTFFANFILRDRVKSLKARKAENTQKLALLQEKIKEVKSFEELNKKFKDRKQIIEELRRNQSQPVKVLDELSKRLTDGIWLDDLGITTTDIKMSGIGFTNEDVVNFVQTLKASPLLSDVYLHETAQNTSDGVSVYKFSITMKVKI